jgi:hypothetical protein
MCSVLVSYFEPVRVKGTQLETVEEIRIDTYFAQSVGSPTAVAAAMNVPGRRYLIRTCNPVLELNLQWDYSTAVYPNLMFNTFSSLKQEESKSVRA